MQRSWRKDPDKLTFIICQRLPDDALSQQGDAIEPTQFDGSNQMIGDVNLFFSLLNDDDEDDPVASAPGLSNTPATIPRVSAELELMIATPTHQGHGYGATALIMFILYILEHQTHLVEEFLRRPSQTAPEQMQTQTQMHPQSRPRLSRLTAKIDQGNVRSLKLFESVMGFVRVGAKPNYWGEWELRRELEEGDGVGSGGGHRGELMELLRERGGGVMRTLRYDNDDDDDDDHEEEV